MRLVCLLGPKTCFEVREQRASSKFGVLPRQSNRRQRGSNAKVMRQRHAQIRSSKLEMSIPLEVKIEFPLDGDSAISVVGSG